MTGLIPDLKKWRDKSWVLALVAISFFMLLPGFFSIPPVDRDETRFAQSTRQMIASGNYIDIQFQDGKRYKKPIGIYWLQAASINTLKAFDFIKEKAPIWAYRMPSLLGVVAAVIATYFMARIFLTPFGAGLSALMIATSILPGFEARIAKTDGFLLFVIVVAQAILAHAWLRREQALSKIQHGIFWVAIGIGILVKGPIILLVCGLTLVTLSLIDRSFYLVKKMRLLAGIAIALFIALPWFIAIGIQSKGAFFIEAGLVDFLGKVADVKESHGGPPGIYTVLMLVTFWPASLLFVSSLGFLRKDWNARAVLFAVSWAIPSWLVFELTPTKLPHYVLPLYPALALLIGYAFQNGFHVTKIWQKIFLALLFVIPGILGTTGFIGLLVLEGDFQIILIVTVFLAVGSGFYGWKRFNTEKTPSQGVFFLVSAAFFTYFSVYQIVFPKLETLWISNRMIVALEKQERGASCPAPSVISVGYHEPSLAFLGPLDLRFAPSVDVVKALSENPCRLLYVTAQREKAQLEALNKAGLRPIVLETMKGFKLNGGDDVTIKLYRFEKESTVDE